MKTSYAVAIAAILLAVAGCKNKEKEMVGSWSSSQGGATMTLDIKEGHTWTCNLSLAGRSLPMEGEWKLSGDTVTITPTKLMGQSVDKVQAGLAKLPPARAAQAGMVKELIAPEDFTLGADGKTLTSKSPKGGQPPSVFTKSGS